MITLCIALHLYHDPIDLWATHHRGPRVSVLWTECARVTRKDAQRAVGVCGALGPMKCEAFDNGPGEVILENKVRER